MAHSGKTITFATDLLPNEDLIYNLGIEDTANNANNRRWNIFGNLTGNVTGNVSGTAGAVAWTNVSGRPTNVSSFTNDAGYLTSFTETDPTVPSWAKASTKPSYTATEVGALPSSTIVNKVKQSSNSTSAAYKILFTTTASPTSGTDYETYYGSLTYNPSTKALVTGGTIDGITLGNGTSTYIAYYNGNNILQGHALAHFNDVANGKNELVLGASTNNVFGQLALYSTGAKGTYLITAVNNTSAWFTATVPAITGVLAILSAGTAKGSNTKPVKVAATGEIQECSTYAGGTALTLNNVSKAAATAEIYAATSNGTVGQVLKANGGTTAPSWEDEYKIEIIDMTAT